MRPSDEASEERSQEKVDAAAAAEGDDAKEAPVPERVRARLADAHLCSPGLGPCLTLPRRSR
jgi:hypothetical protein